jgi:hypothetical protein
MVLLLLCAPAAAATAARLPAAQQGHSPAAARLPAAQQGHSPASLVARRSALLLGATAYLTGSAPAARAAEGTDVANYKGFNLFGEGSAERCENGQGEACNRLAEGNELILKLQEQSRVNKEKNARQLYEQTIRNLNYGEYFDALDKNLVQLPNGKFASYDIETYTKLRKDGKIKIGAFDQLIDDDGKTAPPPGAADGAAAASTRSVEYPELVAAIKAGGVEGVVFQPPRGDVALALVGGDAMVKADVKASWKKSEVSNILARLKIPNNYAELGQ